MFTGQLNPNKIFAAIFNMIISQQVFADNIKGTFGKLVSEAKTDGSMYGDTKLFYATDVLRSYDWNNDAEAANLLKTYRPAAPKCQKIVIDVFRQIPLTVDNYLSKQAWADEGSFSAFNSVMIGWIRETKRIYDATTYNSYIGTVEAAEQPIKDVEIDMTAYPTVGQAIGETLADLMVNLEDVSRDYNDYKVLRSYSEDDIKVIWNSKFVNQVRKIDLPTLFHNEGLVLKFAEDVLPARYFGKVNDETMEEADEKTRSLVEVDLDGQHYFPGDLLPTGTMISDGSEIAIPTYQEDENVICKVIHKSSVPYMSGFEVETSFFNAKSLSENHYLTFGHNTLQYLKDKPVITVRKKVAE